LWPAVGRLDDGVLGEIAGGQREAGERERADHHAPVGERDLVLQPAHVADVLLVVHRHDHRAGAEEQKRLEEGVGEQVEHADRIGADAHRHEHVAELRAGRIRHDPLDVVLHEADGGGEERGGGADERDNGAAFGASSNSGDSRATMNTPAVTMVAAWISAETGVGPSMASGSKCGAGTAPTCPSAHEQQAGRSRSARRVQPKKVDGLAGERGRLGKGRCREVDRLRHQKQGDYAERKRSRRTRLTTKALIAAALASGL
jgi:hypothetical protein